MKRFPLLLFLPVILFVFQSCEKDIATVRVTYHEATAIYGDLQAIRSQPLNSAPQEIDNPGKIFVGETFILLGEEEKGIHVINNTDPTNPVHSNFIKVPGNREFFVRENFIYAESYYDVVKIDISDPENAVLAERAEFVFNEEMKNSAGESLIGFSFEEVSREVDPNSDLYSDIIADNRVYFDFLRNIIPQSAVPASFAGNSASHNGTVNRIAHAWDHVYILGQSDLYIIRDVPGNFEVVDNVSFQFSGWGLETVFPYEDKLFIGSRTAMEIYDMSNPENPLPIYTFNHATSCDPVLPVGDAAYITLRTADFSECPGNINALVVLDVSDLNTPRQVKEIPMISPFGMAYFGNQLYVGEGENGLKVFDASDQLSPELVKWDEGVKAYDILPHPTRTDLVLIAGPNGLEQYTIDSSLSLDLKSKITF